MVTRSRVQEVTSGSGDASQRSWRRRLREVSIVLLVLVGLIGIPELILRVVFPQGVQVAGEPGLWPWVVRHPHGGWMNQRGFKNDLVSISSLGTKGSEPSGKSEGKLRIVCLGDSPTFGVFVDRSGFNYDGGFAAPLSRLLNTDPELVPVEVLNAGVIGHTSSHALRQLPERLAALEPDVLILSYGMTDHIPTRVPSFRTPEPRSKIGRFLLTTGLRFRLFQRAQIGWEQIPGLHPPPGSVRWVEPEQYAYNLRRLAEESRRRELPVLFMHVGLRSLERGLDVPIMPVDPAEIVGMLGGSSLEDLHRQHREYGDRLVEVGVREGVPVVDMEPIFAASRRPPFTRHDFIHPNRHGNLLIARALYGEIKRQGWLDAK